MYPKSFSNLIEHFASLPSVGPKMAERLVLHIFKQSPEDIKTFAESLEGLTQLTSCKRCHTISDQEYCSICRDIQRDDSVLCVVEDALDALSIERAGVFQGKYHILGGLIKMGKEGQDNASELTLVHLLKRLKEEETKEILLAMNPTTEGELTALYIKRQCSQLPHLKVSRIARGLSTGGDIEYADEQTLIGAIQNRKYYSE